MGKKINNSFLSKSDIVCKNIVFYWILKEYFCELSRKNFVYKNRTKTDTGKWVEYTQAIERTVLKELGKIAL